MHDTTILSGRVSAYRIPTDLPEADGTIAWDQTTLVLAEVGAGGQVGLGYSYADENTAHLAQTLLNEFVVGKFDSFDVDAVWWKTVEQVRNLGRPGIASMAVSAINNACWDLKARLLGVSVVRLLGAVRPAVAIYGSGGFTSYSDEELRKQLGGWAEQGIWMVKMKVGSEPDRDLHRVQVAREAIGPNVQLFVDANGAYSVKQALQFADEFAHGYDVRWFEEPVSSDDLSGLRLIRERAPARIDIAAGEYGYTPYYFEAMLAAGAVDVLQADATRCGGVTGFLMAASLCNAHHRPLSAHCAPTLHASLCCAVEKAVHIEYFHDHARLENMLFDGVPQPRGGKLSPDPSRPGFGLEFKQADAERFRL